MTSAKTPKQGAKTASKPAAKVVENCDAILGMLPTFNPDTHVTVSRGEYERMKVAVNFANRVQQQQIANAERDNKPLLQRANELIGGDRQKDYGDKLQNFAQIAMLWQGTLAAKLQAAAKITPEDVALLMIQVKIARLAKSPDHEDSILDVAGYAGCYEAVQLERAAGRQLLGATKDARAEVMTQQAGWGAVNREEQI